MKNNNYSFPPLEDLKEIRKKRGIVNVVLPENATFLEKVKYEIVQTILAYQQDNNLSYEETSHRIGLPLTQTMEILRGNIALFALDSLISYAEHLHLPFQVKIITENKKGMENQTKY